MDEEKEKGLDSVTHFDNKQSMSYRRDYVCLGIHYCKYLMIGTRFRPLLPTECKKPRETCTIYA